MALLKHTYKLASGEQKTSNDWYFRFVLNGKVHFGSTKTSNKKLAARVERAKYEAALARDELGDKPTITVKQGLNAFLKTQEGNGEYRNIKTYVQKMLGTKNSSKHDDVVHDIFGFDSDKQFHELSNADVQKLIVSRRTEKNADATILLELVQLSKAMRLIGKLGYSVPTIDFKELKKDNQLKPSKKKLRYLSVEEETRLMVALDPSTAKNDELKAERADMRDLVVVLVNTGARYSEIAQLKWVDVNLDAKQIVLYRTKTSNESVLPMTDRVHATLVARHISKREKQVYVFENSDKTGHRKYAPKAFVDACKRADITGITLHSLRKTFASRLVQGGLPIYDVSKLLGHANVTTTSNHYAFLAPSKTSQAALDILNKR